MSIARTASGMIQAMTEEVRDDYTWRTYSNVCSGRPEYNKYFPEKTFYDEQSGEYRTLPRMFQTSVAVNSDQGVTWHRVQLYDELADLFRKHLIQNNKVARMHLQGYVRSRVREDTGEIVHYTVVPNKRDEQGYKFFKILGTWDHMRDTSGEGDPFEAAAMAANAETAQTDERQEAAQEANDAALANADTPQSEEFPSMFGTHPVDNPASVEGNLAYDDMPF